MTDNNAYVFGDSPVVNPSPSIGQYSNMNMGDGSEYEDDGNAAAYITLALGIASFIGNLFMNRANNENQKELAQYSFDQQKELINLQNQYNSPSNQLSLYKEAGLNPALMYQNALNSRQSEIAKYDAPNLNAGNVDASSLLSTALGMRQLSLKERMNEAEINNMEYKNRLLKVQAEHEESKWSWFKTFHGIDSNIDESPFMQEFNANLQRVKNENDLFDLRKEAISFDNQIKGLSLQEKEFYINNIQPLMAELAELRNNGLSISNATNAIDNAFRGQERIYQTMPSVFRLVHTGVNLLFPNSGVTRFANKRINGYIDKKMREAGLKSKAGVR